MKYQAEIIMKTLKRILTGTGVGMLISMTVQAAPEYAMSCSDVIDKLNREATAEAQERFVDLEGSCMGVVDRGGNLYMHTKMVVRRVRGSKVTLYLPATDRTIEIEPGEDARVEIEGRKVRPRSLQRGQELNLYVSVDKFTQPVIDEIVLPTETDELISSPAEVAPALPTTG